MPTISEKLANNALSKGKYLTWGVYDDTIDVYDNAQNVVSQGEYRYIGSSRGGTVCLNPEVTDSECFDFSCNSISSTRRDKPTFTTEWFGTRNFYLVNKFVGANSYVVIPKYNTPGDEASGELVLAHTGTAKADCVHPCTRIEESSGDYLQSFFIIMDHFNASVGANGMVSNLTLINTTTGNPLLPGTDYQLTFVGDKPAVLTIPTQDGGDVSAGDNISYAYNYTPKARESINLGGRDICIPTASLKGWMNNNPGAGCNDLVTEDCLEVTMPEMEMTADFCWDFIECNSDDAVRGQELTFTAKENTSIELDTYNSLV